MGLVVVRLGLVRMGTVTIAPGWGETLPFTLEAFGLEISAQARFPSC